MTLSLRQFARSRRLRAMGALAWLMLVINSLGAAPLGMAGMTHAHAMAVTMTAVGGPAIAEPAVVGPAVGGPAVGRHVHQTAPMAAIAPSDADHADCCGTPGTRHCACAAICASALAPMTATTLTPLAMATIYAIPSRISPPSLATSPPLRPPAV